MTVTPDRPAPPTSAAGGYRGYSTQAIADMIALGCTESVVRSVIDLRIAARAEQAARAALTGQRLKAIRGGRSRPPRSWPPGAPPRPRFWPTTRPSWHRRL